MSDPKYQQAYLDLCKKALESNLRPLSIAEFIRLMDELNNW